MTSSMHEYKHHFLESDLWGTIQISEILKMHPCEGKELFMMLPGDLTRSRSMKLNMRKYRLYIYKVFPIVISIKL